MRLTAAVFSLWVGLTPVLVASEVKVLHHTDGWQLLVDGRPFLVRGICYSADKIGEDPNRGTLRDWMVVDDDNDGHIDAPYQSWVDANHNDTQETDEPAVGDFKLLADMGVNTIRVYHHPSAAPALEALYPEGSGGATMFNHAPNKSLLRELFERYGIRVAMGDEIGSYAVGSGASWNPGTDYTNPQQRAHMRRSVEEMVADFKDEPYLLFWVLGNENNYPFTHTNAAAHPVEYARFVNEMAQLIHRLDPHHPVVLANGETKGLRTYATYAPDIDIFGVNTYRRPGFGSLWKEVESSLGKPVLLTEYGISIPRVTQGAIDETYQSAELRRDWCDIESHSAGHTQPGNAIGGFMYAWLDNWWQDGNPDALFMVSGRWNHEAVGLSSQGNGQNSPLERQLRKAYFMYQNLWKTHHDQCS